MIDNATVKGVLRLVSYPVERLESRWNVALYVPTESAVGWRWLRKWESQPFRTATEAANWMARLVDSDGVGSFFMEPVEVVSIEDASRYGIASHLPCENWWLRVPLVFGME